MVQLDRLPPRDFPNRCWKNFKVDNRRERRELRKRFMNLRILRVQERTAIKYFVEQRCPGSGDAQALDGVEQDISISGTNQVKHTYLAWSHSKQNILSF